jgi:hypothetical protein
VTAQDHPKVGAAGFLAALAEAGIDATIRGEYVVFPYVIEVGGRAGQQIQVGLAVPRDWPLTPPPGPHLSPRLGHPRGAVHDSPLGPGWEYWSRPVPNWPHDRSLRGYLRHLRTLFAQL